MPYPFTPGDTLTPISQRFNEAVEAGRAYTDEKLAFTTGVYTLRANQTIPKYTKTTVGNFYLNEGVSHPDIGSYIALNTDAGRGVWTFLISGYYQVFMKSQWVANNTGHRFIYPWIDTNEVDVKSAPPGSDAPLTVEYNFPALWFNAGQYIRMRVVENADPTGGLVLVGSASGFETQVFFEYKGAGDSGGGSE